MGVEGVQGWRLKGGKGDTRGGGSRDAPRRIEARNRPRQLSADFLINFLTSEKRRRRRTMLAIKGLFHATKPYFTGPDRYTEICKLSRDTNWRHKLRDKTGNPSGEREVETDGHTQADTRTSRNRVSWAE